MSINTSEFTIYVGIQRNNKFQPNYNVESDVKF